MPLTHQMLTPGQCARPDRASRNSESRSDCGQFGNRTAVNSDVANNFGVISGWRVIRPERLGMLNTATEGDEEPTRNYSFVAARISLNLCFSP